MGTASQELSLLHGAARWRGALLVVGMAVGLNSASGCGSEPRDGSSEPGPSDAGDATPDAPEFAGDDVAGEDTVCYTQAFPADLGELHIASATGPVKPTAANSKLVILDGAGHPLRDALIGLAYEVCWEWTHEGSTKVDGEHCLSVGPDESDPAKDATSWAPSFAKKGTVFSATVRPLPDPPCALAGNPGAHDLVATSIEFDNSPPRCDSSTFSPDIAPRASARICSCQYVDDDKHEVTAVFGLVDSQGKSVGATAKAVDGSPNVVEFNLTNANVSVGQKVFCQVSLDDGFVKVPVLIPIEVNAGGGSIVANTAAVCAGSSETTLKDYDPESPPVLASTLQFVRCPVADADCPDGICSAVKLRHEIKTLSGTVCEVGGDEPSVNWAIQRDPECAANESLASASVRLCQLVDEGGNNPTELCSTWYELGDADPPSPSTPVLSADSAAPGSLMIGEGFACTATMSVSSVSEQDFAKTACVALVNGTPVQIATAGGPVDDYRDAAGDAENSTWKTTWGPAYLAPHAKKGDKLTCACRTVDEKGNRSAAAEAKTPVVIANTPPVVGPCTAQFSVVDEHSQVDVDCVDYFDADVDDFQSLDDASWIVFDVGCNQANPLALKWAEGKSIRMRELQAEPNQMLCVRVVLSDIKLDDAPDWADAPDAVQEPVPNVLPTLTVLGPIELGQNNLCSPSATLKVRWKDPDYHPLGLDLTATFQVGGQSVADAAVQTETTAPSDVSGQVSLAIAAGQLDGFGKVEATVTVNDHAGPPQAAATGTLLAPEVPFCTPAPSDVQVVIDPIAWTVSCTYTAPDGVALLPPAVEWMFGGEQTWKPGSATAPIVLASLCLDEPYSVRCRVTLTAIAPVGAGSVVASATVPSDKSWLNNEPPSYNGSVAIVGPGGSAPSTKPGAALFCQVTDLAGYHDDLGTVASFVLRWFVNGSAAPVHEGVALPAAVANAYSAIQCRAYPDDGCQLGAFVASPVHTLGAADCPVTVSHSTNYADACTSAVECLVNPKGGCTAPPGTFEWRNASGAIVATGKTISPADLLAAGAISAESSLRCSYRATPQSASIQATQSVYMLATPAPTGKLELDPPVPLAGGVVQAVVTFDDSDPCLSPPEYLEYFWTIDGQDADPADLELPEFGPFLNQCGVTLQVVVNATWSSGFQQQLTASAAVERRVGLCFSKGSTGALAVPAELSGSQGTIDVWYDPQQESPAEGGHCLVCGDGGGPSQAPFGLVFKGTDHALWIKWGSSVLVPTTLSLDGEPTGIRLSWGPHAKAGKTIVEVALDTGAVSPPMTFQSLSAQPSTSRLMFANTPDRTNALGGCVDEIRVFDDMLTSPLSPTPIPGGDFCKLLAHLPIETVYGTSTVDDWSGAGAHGTKFGGGYQSAGGVVNECDLNTFEEPSCPVD